jgi:hypothetical protein
VLKREGAADSLLEQACWALRIMTADDAENRKASGHGGVEAVISVLRREGAADSLLEQARSALICFVADSGNLVFAREFVGKDKLTSLLKSH